MNIETRLDLAAINTYLSHFTVMIMVKGLFIVLFEARWLFARRELK
jgi:hypothetical protein